MDRTAEIYVSLVINPILITIIHNNCFKLFDFFVVYRDKVFCLMNQVFKLDFSAKFTDI